MKELSKAYNPKEHEDKIYEAWERSGFFNPDNLSGEPYSIMMPPPNVTGVLHLGHALENSLMDIMARFQRMRGKKVLLIPGTDHAALPTQAKVEKLLMKEGMKNPREELGREKLVEKIREFAEQSRSTILGQIKKMGTSCDWSRLAYTFDEARNKAVREMFTRMYADGLIYRGYRVVNWSVKGQSTCSDDEVIYVERPSKLYTFKYSNEFPIAIATTRPETKLGDTAVAVHPDDERYQQYIGKVFAVDVGAEKPLEIKVIADEHIDRKFGTGALGVTPAHSPIDFETYEKQKAKGDPIQLISVIGTDGKMTDAAGKQYAGLSVEAAREKFVAWLTAQGLLISEEDITQNVGTSDRFGDVIEPIPMTQWWLDVQKIIPGRGKSLRDLMKDAVTVGLGDDKDKIVSITPERFKKMYLDRIDTLRDWCLSRQIWWGHRIPVWYREEEIFVGVEAPQGDGWVQDEDTLDTWFSSGLWTFSTLGWPDTLDDVKTFHPTTWIQMGYEIIYLWMMRMILMSSYAVQDIPFHDVYIHGILRDEEGKKFSKSAGNAVDPLDITEKYGTDALRFSLMSGVSPGNDAKFYEEKVESARNLVNKLWNMSRFILLHIESPQKDVRLDDVKENTLADSWILMRLSTVEKEITDHLEAYRFSQAAELLRDFTWNELADWYLEIAKIEGDKSAILNVILNTILKLWHPYMPFVTEAIWQEVYGKEAMLMVEKWPALQGGPEDAGAPSSEKNQETVAAFTLLQSIITSIRTIRNEYKIEPKKEIAVTIQTEKYQPLLDEQAMIIQKLARVSSLTITGFGNVPEGSVAVVPAEGLNVFVELSGSIDTQKEQQRIEKELVSIEPYITSLEKKLNNREFTSNAPEAVVVGEQKKLDEARAKCEQLKTQRNSLTS